MNGPTRSSRQARLIAAVVVVALGTPVAWYILSRPKVDRTSDRRSNAPIQPNAGRTGPRPTQVWVVAIGIDNYRDDAIPDCQGAVRDAEAVGRWFARTAGWEARNVLFMDDRGQPRHGTPTEHVDNVLPTRENLDWALPRVASHPGPAERRGRGLLRRPGDGEAAHGGLPAGGARPIDPTCSRSTPGPAALDATGWQLDEAIDKLASTGRNPIVCWLDTSLARPRAAGSTGRGRLPAVGRHVAPERWSAGRA